MRCSSAVDADPLLHRVYGWLTTDSADFGKSFWQTVYTFAQNDLEALVNHFPYLVVGSGPAGIAAAVALVGQGHAVIMLDVGDELDAEKSKRVTGMSQQRVEDWDAADLNDISGTRGRTADAVHSKQSYGSSYSFASEEVGPRVAWQGTRGFHHSHARGGLSNIWGAAMLPCRSEDITDWPISLRELEPHYRAVMEFVPCTASSGSLEDILPRYGSPGRELEMCAQARDVEDHLIASQTTLERRGIRFGKSRLAIHTGCQHCSLCLSGCPYGLIWSANHTLRDLLATGLLTYRKRHLVTSFRHEGDHVIVTGTRLDDDTTFSLQASRLFLAAGVLPTASIVLESKAAYGTKLHLHDSQYYIYPLLKWRANEGVEMERMHTSAQLFVEMETPSISPHGIHLQLYGYSAFLREELERTFLRLPLRNRFFRRHFLGRLMIAQGFLHSRHSGTIALQLIRGADGRNRLDCESTRGWITLWKVLQVGWKLLRCTPLTRLLPLVPGVQIPSPGTSNHSGGSLPMRKLPDEFETDTLGRLPGYPRVHIVDASILPSIPATTITLTLMANSHRIATHAQALESK
jgi:choline dehydrogenase-like flavoprotein